MAALLEEITHHGCGAGIVFAIGKHILALWLKEADYQDKDLGSEYSLTTGPEVRYFGFCTGDGWLCLKCLGRSKQAVAVFRAHQEGGHGTDGTSWDTSSQTERRRLGWKCLGLGLNKMTT